VNRDIGEAGVKKVRDEYFEMGMCSDALGCREGVKHVTVYREKVIQTGLRSNGKQRKLSEFGT
jgi:hypothetical protein